MLALLRTLAARSSVERVVAMTLSKRPEIVGCKPGRVDSFQDGSGRVMTYPPVRRAKWRLFASEPSFNGGAGASMLKFSAPPFLRALPTPRFPVGSLP